MTFHFRFFEDMFAVLADSVRPPERLSVSRAAAKYRYLKEATHFGLWDNDIAPYMIEPMDELESLEFTGTIIVGPARSGKSDICFNWIAYSAKCDPGDMMIVHMTQATARDWSQGDLRKFLRHSTAVGSLLMPGKQNLNVYDIKFSSGMRTLVKWPTISELSGKTLRRIWLMDHDRMPMDIEGEGAPFDLARKRVTTYGRHGMAVAESSPGFEITNHRWVPQTLHEAPPTEGILSIYNRGDRRRFYWRCASCDKPFEGEFSHLRPKEGIADHVERAESVLLHCPHCDFGHTHDPDPDSGQPGKTGLNKAGKWIKDGETWEDDGSLGGRAARSDIASFWIKGVAAAFVSWKDLYLKWLKALDDYERTGDTGSLKATVNLDQGLPFTPPSMSSGRTPEDLMANAKGNTWGNSSCPQAPDWTRFITGAVDIQGGYFVVQMHAHGEDGRIGVIDRFSIRKSKRLDEDGQFYLLKPKTYLEDWFLLVDEVLDKSYELEDGAGRRMGVRFVVCDSGGEDGVTNNAYEFWRWLRDTHGQGLHRRFQLVKGNSRIDSPRAQITYPDSTKKDRRAASRGEVPVLMLNVNSLKDALDGLLDREAHTPGSIMYADHLEHWFFSELTVEVKRANKGWENPKKLRNEAWDLLVYTLGLRACSKFGPIELIKWDDPPAWAAPWDENIMVFTPKDGAPFRPVEEYALPSMADLAKRLA